MGTEVRTNQLKEVATVSWAQRWQVYSRFQELEIPCHCAPNQALQVAVDNCTQAMQVRSVLWQLSAPRLEQVEWLMRCWKNPANPPLDADT